MVFCAIVAFELFKAFNARSDEFTVFKLGVFSNRWLALSVLVAIILQMVVIYVPLFQAAFDTVPLGIESWGIVILAGASLFAIEETRKAFFPNLFNLGKWTPL